MANNQEDHTKNTLPHDPFEGMGELSAIDPSDSHDADAALTQASPDAHDRSSEDPMTSPYFNEMLAELVDLSPPVPFDESDGEMDQPMLETSVLDQPQQADEETPTPVTTGDTNPQPSPGAALEPAIEAESVPDDDGGGAFDQPLIGDPPLEEPASLEALIEAIDDEAVGAFAPVEGLAQESGDESPAEVEQFVVFSLSGADYAVPILNVTEIAYPLEVTPLPNVPEWVLGVANLRGDLISMVDLRTFFGMERTTLSGSARMLVGRTTHEDMTIGFIVDRAHGIRNLPLHEIEKPTAEIESRIAPFLYGAYQQEEHLLALLDLDRVLNSPRLRQFESR